MTYSEVRLKVQIESKHTHKKVQSSVAVSKIRINAFEISLHLKIFSYLVKELCY